MKKKTLPRKRPQAKSRKSPQEKKTRVSLCRRISIWFLTITLLSLLSIIHSLFYKPAIPTALEYVVRPGAGALIVAQDLGLGWTYKTLIKMRGGKVMAGTYDFPRGISIWRVARMTSRGETATVSITIPEGLTIRQIERLLAGRCVHPPEGGAPETAGGGLEFGAEGSLFPSTYIVSKGTSCQSVIDMMAKKMARIRADWESSGSKLPSPLKSWDEVLTLASIVQKETSITSEMPMIAGVYLNRLRKKMRLQADPTVIYAITDGLGDMEGQRLYSKYLWTKSPYNTYRNAGLPPAPIANVGMDAINAVLNPSESNYYYFCADGRGGHAFAETLDDHNRNRATWRRVRN